MCALTHALHSLANHFLRDFAKTPQPPHPTPGVRLFLFFPLSSLALYSFFPSTQESTSLPLPFVYFVACIPYVSVGTYLSFAFFRQHYIPFPLYSLFLFLHLSFFFLPNLSHSFFLHLYFTDLPCFPFSFFLSFQLFLFSFLFSFPYSFSLPPPPPSPPRSCWNSSDESGRKYHQMSGKGVNGRTDHNAISSTHFFSCCSSLPRLSSFLSLSSSTRFYFLPARGFRLPPFHPRREIAIQGKDSLSPPDRHTTRCCCCCRRPAPFFSAHYTFADR